jgi:hypothetical protein
MVMLSGRNGVKGEREQYFEGDTVVRHHVQQVQWLEETKGVLEE